MTRRIVPILSLVAALAACSSNRSNDTNIQPGGSTASRSGDGGGRDGGRRGGQGGAARMNEMLFRNITLSSDQRQRVDAIQARYRTQMDQARQQQSGGDRSAMRDQMRQSMEQQQAEIRAVLTPDQQRQYDQNVADMRARAQQGGDRNAPPQR